ncbi:MAG: hypothetical protein QM500_09660 [Methylococcales bacterium]
MNTVSSVLSYTQDMMMVVLEQQWDIFENMQLKQDEMIKGLFVNQDASFTAQEQENLFEIQSLNQQIIQIAEEHKAEAAHKLRELRQGKSKTGAYQAL